MKKHSKGEEIKNTKLNTILPHKPINPRLGRKVIKEKVISSALDSSDEEDDKAQNYNLTSSSNYNLILLEDLKKAEKVTYPSSYFLMRMSNQLLTSREIKKQYNKIKDPLTFKENRLCLEQQRNELALKNLKEEDSEEIKSFIETSQKENVQKLKRLKEHKQQREELYPKFKATFPFIPLKLSPTFVEKYNQHFNATENALKIQDHLLSIRENLIKKKLIASDIEKLCNFWEIKCLTLNRETEEVKEKISNKITNLEGKCYKACVKFWQPYFTNIGLKKCDKNIGSVTAKKLKDQLKTALEDLIKKIDKNYINNNQEFYSELCKKLKVETVLENRTKKVIEEIDYILGKSPTDEATQEYLRLTNKEKYSEAKNNSEIIKNSREKISELTTANIDDLEKLYKNIKDINPFITDPEYLKEVANQDFLVQVLAYRKINRDKAKNILVEIQDRERAVVPPGLNSTVDILQQGSMSHFVGEMGSYKYIGIHHEKTLRNFLSYFCSKSSKKVSDDSSIISKKETKTTEREEEFESLYIIEVMRNPSALLTNAMFFELANAEFQPFRFVNKQQVEKAGKEVGRINKKFNKSASSKKVKEGVTENRYKKELGIARENLKSLEEAFKESKPVKKYNFSLIHEQMPMAMKDAVTAAIYLENSFKEHLNKRLYYDYRSNIENKGGAADVLAQRDNDILFDWLCYKAGLKELGMFNKLCGKDILPTLKLHKWKITEDEGTHIEKNGFKFLLHNKGNGYTIDCINKFPLKILNDLTKEWYGKRIFETDSECNFIIKASTQNSYHKTKHPKNEDVTDYSSDNLTDNEDDKGSTTSKSIQALQINKMKVDQPYNKKSDTYPDLFKDSIEMFGANKVVNLSNSLIDKIIDQNDTQLLLAGLTSVELNNS